MLISLWGSRPNSNSDAGQVKAAERQAGEQPTPQQLRRDRVRRGVTALEYLVCLSSLIAVVILAVQHIGSITGGKLANTAKLTEKANSAGKN